MIANRIGRMACCVVLAQLLVLCAAAQGAEPPARDAKKEKSIGRKIEAFSLRDHRDQTRELRDFADQKAIVVAFLGTECPLARMYGPRLAALAKELAPQGVAVVGVVSNVQDSAEDVERYVKDCEISFPVLLDADCKLADQFGATRTPEVFVLDAERVIRYRGRVDDQFGVGVKRPQIGRRDLAEAVTELLAGKPVSQAETEAAGCLIGRPKQVAADSSITYSKDIAPILNARCVICHREGEIGPFPLTSYEETIGWADTIVEVLDAGRMPPWFANPEHGKFLNDSRMSDKEKETFRAWAKNGCPPGDSADLPPAREFPEGWSIPKPDLVIPMRAKPYHVPATGVIGYQHFVADPGFTEDKWVVASEVRPGNRAVVHHVLIFLLGPGESAAMRMMSGELAGAYAPGAPPRLTPEGV
ncbi:MAG TPA: redoxin domain-containing protein, partial [Pirellulales bacterium]